MKCSSTLARDQSALQKAGHPLPRTCMAGAPPAARRSGRVRSVCVLLASRSSSASLQQSMRGAVAVSTPPEGEGMPAPTAFQSCVFSLSADTKCAQLDFVLHLQPYFVDFMYSFHPTHLNEMDVPFVV
ncbi:hypothetical protein CEXT_41351 [Caerostris extrusa]|uniref:Uncharacterized protein n=1 Tax=Caerostris extrusa TaxID=172846 RepID=A0AAV4XEN8_CAEEX|nr:hypothetical protein CEXT_41351 [Caerostris extrusa]